MIDKSDLRSLLRLDGATCLVMAIVLSSLAPYVASRTGISPGFLLWTGLVLFPIGGFMLIAAQRRTISYRAVHMIIPGNIVWIIASFALPILGVINPNFSGWLVLAAQAAVVTGLTILEIHAAKIRTGDSLSATLRTGNSPMISESGQ